MLLVALAGLFAMHGLSDHGAAGHLYTQASTTSAGDAAPASHGTSEHGAAGHMDRATGRASTDSANDPMPQGGHGAGLMGLCLAVLAAALTLVLAAARTHRRPLFTTANAGWALPTLLARARDPDPPDLRRLSIQRC